MLGVWGRCKPPNGVRGRAPEARQTHSGMPNLRKNPFSTDFYHLFQSTDKKLFMAESTDFFLLGSATTPPPPTLDSRDFAPREPIRLRRVNFLGYYPKSQDFSEFRLGNPAHFGNNIIWIYWKLVENQVPGSTTTPLIPIRFKRRSLVVTVLTAI